MKRLVFAIFNFIVFVGIGSVISIIWWLWAGKPYIFSNQPVGGDYFNALTYANFFSKHLPFPPQGWIPFWNEGSPLIGGYPWLSFYLMYPLTKIFDIASAMEIFAAFSQLLFIILSILLFLEVSKNWLVAAAFALIVATTKATYYPLVTAGFFSSATAQWYLPLALFFLYKFGENRNVKYLMTASIVIGISLLHHAGVSFLTILLPSLAILAFLPRTHWVRGLPFENSVKTKIKMLSIFLLLSISLGSMGLYTLFLQLYLGSGTDTCQSPECWGDYPRHFITWMSHLPLAIIGVFLSLCVILKLFRKSIQFSIIIPSIAAVTVLAAYLLAAKLHLINGPANVIFPIRTFWALNLFLLIIAASLFQIIRMASFRFSYFVSAIILALIIATLSTKPQVLHPDRTNTDPIDAASYVVPKYKTKDLTEIVPDWTPLNETNWRLDTFNPGLTHWWNFISQIPSVRGYSAHPVGTQRDWQYFLQVATRSHNGANQELIKNRALFLMDAYGIGYRENSIASYPSSILNDPQITIKTEERRNSTWHQFSPNMVSPIVSPTNSNLVLFIGDEKGYESFIRIIAMTNLNSFFLIPVLGRDSIDGINSEELKHFKSLVLYRFKGNKWSKITSYVKNGGMVFIETGAQDLSSRKLQEIFPIESVNMTTIQGTLAATVNTEFDKGYAIKTENFSPFIFEGGPWKVSSASLPNIRSWAKPVLSRENQVLLVRGTLGKGEVVWSGMNIPFHIVQNDNYEEAKMFGNILGVTAAKTDIKSTFTVNRPHPEQIIVEGNDFSGIYFKENYHSGWKARVDGKKLKIYKAGLDFMYISIPKDLQNQPLNVSIYFAGNHTTWGLFLVSTISFLLSFFYLLFPRLFHVLTRTAGNYLNILAIRHVKSWLDKE